MFMCRNLNKLNSAVYNSSNYLPVILRTVVKYYNNNSRNYVPVTTDGHDGDISKVF